MMGTVISYYLRGGTRSNDFLWQNVPSSFWSFLYDKLCTAVYATICIKNRIS